LRKRGMLVQPRRVDTMVTMPRESPVFSLGAAAAGTRFNGAPRRTLR
jgi:hypothetical protein